MTEQVWHTVSISIPFSTPTEATLVKRVIQVDELLRPEFIQRSITVADAVLTIEFKATTVAFARVAVDHCLSDIQLVTQTMHKFAPKSSQVTEEQEKGERSKMEIGLMGSWGGVAR